MKIDKMLQLIAIYEENRKEDRVHVIYQVRGHFLPMMIPRIVSEKSPTIARLHADFSQTSL